ncbi:toll/interleukin-1 receptor domain-containing protein [Sorangium sp. So ce134]
MEARPTVFISYSHQDKTWKNRLVQHLKVLEKQGALEVWDSGRIGAGEDWQKEIEGAIERARVAVLLVSADFLASDFVLREEVPRLLNRRQAEGLRVIPVLVRPCLWRSVPWLAEMQLCPSDSRALSAGADHVIEEDLAAISAEVLRVATAGTHETEPRHQDRHSATARPRADERGHLFRAEASPARQASKTGAAFGMLVSVVFGSLGFMCVCMSSPSAPATIDRKIEDLSSRNAELDRLLNAKSALADSSGSPSAVSAPSGLPPAAHVPTAPAAKDEAAPSEDLPAPVYGGTVYDMSTREAIRGARVTLLETPCEALTNDAGVFDFARCNRAAISQLGQAQITVHLPSGKTCINIPIEQPPTVNSIWVDALGCSRRARKKSVIYRLFYE